jgi:ATP-dependent RNA helicase RhlB
MIKKFFGKILSKKDETGENKSMAPVKHATRKERIKNSDSYIQVKETEVWEPGTSKKSGTKSKDKNKIVIPAFQKKRAGQAVEIKAVNDNEKNNNGNNKNRGNTKPSSKRSFNNKKRSEVKVDNNNQSSDQANKQKPKSVKEAKEAREPRKAKDARKAKESGKTKKPKDARKAKEPKDARKSKEPRKAKEPKGARKAKEPRKPRKDGDSGKPKESEKPYTWTLDNYVVEPKEGEVRFHDFDFPLRLMNGIADNDFQYCTPIQAMALPPALDGKDVCAKALTGTGKTAAFLLTIQTLLWRKRLDGQRAKGQPRALILAPTRELCIQICKDSQTLGKYMPFTSFAVYGGMDLKKQQNFLRTRVVDIVAATPGRLLGFSRSRDIDLSQVEILIIDEADRMLDMGFIQDIKKIIYKTPHKDKRQTMLFSATLTKDIINLASQWMREQVVIEDKEDDLVVDNIDQQIYLVTSDQKFGILKKLLATDKCTKTLVFANRKSTTRKLSEKLSRAGIKNELLSGDVPQKKRISVLNRFKSGDINVIIATDVAGRGIHVDEITHVVNFELPYDADDYVHRIGRTGRAGEKGQAVSFACEDESFIIPEIEKYMNCELKCSMPPEELMD